MKDLSWRIQSNITGRTASVTALYKNYTLTSPTVYIEFKTALATDACGRRVGKAYFGALLPVNPLFLYSVAAHSGDFLNGSAEGGGITSYYQSDLLNFHDLDGLPPASVYVNQPKCFWTDCGPTIVNTTTRSWCCLVRFTTWIPSGRVVVSTFEELGILQLRCIPALALMPSLPLLNLAILYRLRRNLSSTVQLCRQQRHPAQRLRTQDR